MTSKPFTETASFGDVAIKLGFITPSQLEEAMKVQVAASKAGLRKRLGEILIKKGYLTPEQFQQVIRGQTTKQKRIGAYELISKLGEGGMGSVFKARQVFLDRIIALKILSPKLVKNKKFCERFQREARAVAKLNHPHIVSGIDVGKADGYIYFAMEYVDGESLGQYLHNKGGKLDERTALEFARQTALALQHAHQNNLLHRDVKPDNLLLDANHTIVKLADLGLVRSTESAEDDSALAHAGQAVGTPFYISPEQARGLFDLTPATDIYSLGATLFHLLTGKVPFDGPNAAVIMTRHVTDPVPSVCKLSPEVSPAAEKIVTKCMQKNPENRYHSAQALAIDIEHLLAGSQAGNKAVAEKPVLAVLPLEPKPDREPLREDKPQAARETPEMHATTHPGTAALRSVRRRSRGGDLFGMAVILVVITLLSVLLYSLNPKNIWKPQSQPQPEHTTKRAEKPTPAPPTLQIVQPPATPAVIQPNAAGGFSFKDDFETALPHYEADPLMAPQEPVRRVVDGTKVNHVLRLARIIDDEAACMARLLLPAGLEWSQSTSISFTIWANSSSAAAPEIQVWVDHRVHDFPKRFLSKWSYKNLDFKSGWKTVEVSLDTANARLMSRQLSDKPQFIAILAGKPGEDMEVFIDNLNVTDPGNADVSTPATVDKEQPVVPPPPKNEAPVAPPPAGPGKEPPVVPPPRKTE